jgi:hypothetical protein
MNKRLFESLVVHPAADSVGLSSLKRPTSTRPRRPPIEERADVLLTACKEGMCPCSHEPAAHSAGDAARRFDARSIEGS